MAMNFLSLFNLIFKAGFDNYAIASQESVDANSEYIQLYGVSVFQSIVYYLDIICF